MAEAYASPVPAGGDLPRFSRHRLYLLIGVPLAWAVLLLFHPMFEGTERYLELKDKLAPWMTVHVGMVVFIPLMAFVVYLLVRDVSGAATRVSQIGLALFAVFYGAYETLQGVGTGVLVEGVNALPRAERGTGAELVQSFGENALIRDLGVFSAIGSLGFLAAMLGAAVALRRVGAPLAVAVLLGLSGFLITAHPPPLGPTGLVLFIIAVSLLQRSRSGESAAVPLRRPRPT